jgi:hypothetical protein
MMTQQFHNKRSFRASLTRQGVMLVAFASPSMTPWPSYR